MNKDLRCAFLHNTLHVGCSLQTRRRSASSLVNDVRIAKCFLVLNHKCYPIMFLEIVCSMINNLQSQKCSCVKQMPRSVLSFRLQIKWEIPNCFSKHSVAYNEFIHK